MTDWDSDQLFPEDQPMRELFPGRDQVREIIGVGSPGEEYDFGQAQMPTLASCLDALAGLQQASAQSESPPMSDAGQDSNRKDEVSHARSDHIHRRRDV